MLVPIACRFVPYDQWIVTHLDDRWKVKQVKHWILAKCNLLSSGPRTHRSVSPIIFSPTIRARSSLDSVEEGYNEDDEHSDQDLPPRHRPPKPGVYSGLNVNPRLSSQSTQPGSSPLVDQYTLISFSTGSILEDEFGLSWYHLRPYELLEMHPAGTVASLQRGVLAEYIQPYFQAKVRILRVVWNHRSGRFEAPDIDMSYEHYGCMTKDQLAHSLSPALSNFQPDKRRKTKANWKARWVVINQGILSLCKEHATNPPVQQFALGNMTALRGADALERAFSVITPPRVVCVKFRPRSASMTAVVSSPPSPPTSPISEESRSNHHESVLYVDSVSDTEQRAEQDSLKGCGCGYDSSDSYKTEGEWVILDMLDDHAFSNILRVLHREAYRPMSSSFTVSASITAVSPRSPVAMSFESNDTVPYPEWRIHTVKNARKAGMGDVGRPMAWVLWTEKGLGESLLGNIRHHRQTFLQEMQYKTPAIPRDAYGDDDGSDDESEVEWEGWVRDLERQSRARWRSGRDSRSGGSSQLPSPPLSEESPCGSPRVRSPSLSGSIPPPPHGQYPNIGNVVGARGYHGVGPSRTPGKIRNSTVSTVSVGRMPSSRRRSSTVSATTKHDKGKQVEERLLDRSAAHANAQPVWASAGMPCPPNTPVRAARSGSSLRTAALACESDAPEPPEPPSPSKRQSAFMRGMTLRAGKLVRGLESAIDFVDEKTV